MKISHQLVFPSFKSLNIRVHIFMPITDLKSRNGLSDYEYFANKLLEELDVLELAYIHLQRSPGKVILKDCILSSSLYYLMETAQASFNNNRTRIYNPLFSYFAVLDQIGGAYGTTLKSTKCKAGVKVALELFGGYDKVEVEKLYALRNGLYHDGSLMNVSANKKSNVIFRISQEAINTITPPIIEWDGIYHDSLDQYVTKINTKRFNQDVEAIVKNCCSQLRNGTLTLKINDQREFFYKFLFASKL